MNQQAMKSRAVFRKVFMFDQLAKFMSDVTHKTGRISCKDFVQMTGLSERSAQRNLKELELAGYLSSDDKCPKGYIATDKAKQIFGSATWSNL
ncbi:hypothetical protein [Acinetobacter baumannii]|uniref:hypothetical protein n=1 Tax=Acinetobacter baumannii TaxID=470 RepID=UPI00280F493B|nr:hypothetical protein [Acinetobacter baumannii]MDQ8959587.1 hypothetical protein [Acinetobacter baumannii]